MEQQNKRFTSNSEKLNTDKSKFNKPFDESYKFLCETASDAIFHISNEGTIISANPASIELFGYSHEELLGIKISALFPQGEKSFFDTRLKEENSKFEWNFIHKDGHSVILETYIRCLNDSTFQVIGKPRNKNIGFSDLDGQRLEILLQMYQMENSSPGEITDIALTYALKLTESLDGFIAFLSDDEKYITLSAWSKNNNDPDNLKTDSKTIEIKYLDFVKDVIKSKEPYISNDIKNLSSINLPSKHISISKIMIVPLLYHSKFEMLAILCNKKLDYNLSDVKQISLLMEGIWKIIIHIRSDRKLKESEHILKQQNEEFISINEELNQSNSRIMEMNEELKLSKKKAEESDLLKSAFLANMSHEIRTPMNAISGFAELLKLPGLNEETLFQYIDIINSNSQQLLSIIDDIIDISKIEAGQIKISYSKINVNKLLNEIALIFNTVAKSKGIEFKFEFGLKNEEAFAETDEIRLRQIINNLLNNAFKFTSNGSITLGYIARNNVFEFFIKDTGIGIQNDKFEIIFERFRQVESGMSRKYGGTGLGLTISRVLVELLGGRIWLDSQIDKGSTFYFTIPSETSEKIEGKYLNSKEKLNYSWPDKTILIAEDEEFNFFLIHELLSGTNAKVIRAKNGKEAIETCQKNNSIDLVLMDIKMPEIDGYEAAKIIKSFRPKLPIIAQTAYAMSEDRSKALKAGCDDYISKPLNKNRLLSMISSSIEK